MPSRKRNSTPNLHRSPAPVSAPWRDASEGSDWGPNLDQVAGGMACGSTCCRSMRDWTLHWLGLWTGGKVSSPCRSAMATEHCHRIAETKRWHQTHHTPGELHQACGSSSVPTLGQGKPPSLGTTPDGGREHSSRAAGPGMPESGSTPQGHMLRMCSTDIANAFGTLHRERVLGAMETEAPFLLPYFAAAWDETGSVLWTMGPTDGTNTRQAEEYQKDLHS